MAENYRMMYTAHMMQASSDGYDAGSRKKALSAASGLWVKLFGPHQ